MKNRINTLYLFQWREFDNDYCHQYECNNLLTILNQISNNTKQKLISISTYDSGVILAEFEYINYFISTEMERLIDCEKIPE